MKKIYFIILIPIGLLIHGTIQAFKNNAVNEYFSIPLYAIINIIIALVFAYFLTQYKNDKLRKKASLEKIIEKILVSISDEKMYDIKEEKDLNYIRINQRSISNRIDLLEKNENGLSLAKEIKYVKDTYDEYWEFVSDHINDINHLTKSYKELYNKITNMANGLEKLIMLLYC